MARVPTEATDERRFRIWRLMLQGYNPQSIKKELNIPNPTMYRDLKFLTNQSKKQVYDLAKGAHMLMYRRAIEGISLTLSEVWNKFNGVTIPNSSECHIFV